jgi:peptide/nickel transport system substrate-binding protein
MTVRLLSSVMAAALAAAFVAAPAAAQKSKDTIRYATTEAIKTLDPYFFTHFEASPMYETIYETLVAYDSRAHKIVPMLAKSWTQVEPGVYDIELRDDIVFSNGDKYDADDAVYFINWMIDPAVRIHNKPRYMWAKGAEKLGTHKLRLRMVKNTPKDLLDMGGYTWQYNSKIHSKLDDKSAYGRNPIGTGPYRVASMDSSRAIVLVPNEKFTPAPYRIKARANRIEAVFIPDQDVQIAQIMTGGVEIMRDPSPDHMNEMAKNKNLEISAFDSDNMIYLQFDAMGRSGHKPVQDARVRRALVAAINQDELIKHLAAGGHAAKRLDSMCRPFMQGCEKPAVKLPAYNAAAAKKLLAEAGYPNGFEIELISRNPSKDAAIGIAGYWQEIGVKTNVQLLQIGALDKARAEGKLQAYIGERPYTTPDASHPMDIFFFDKRRDYWNDEQIRTWATEALSEFNADKRADIYKRIFDKINTEAYMMAVHTLPSVFIHSKDVKIHDNPLVDTNTNAGDFSWK